MATSVSGIVSGLDTASLIKASMALERLPLERMQKQLSSTQSKISAMGQVKSAIAGLQEAAKAIADAGGLYSYKASLSNADVATVTANGKAAQGSYQIEVERLASSHKLASAGGVDPSAGGSLTIELGSVAGGSFTAKAGSSPVTVNVAAGASLSDVAKAINGSDAGVSATVINGENGPQLMLTSKETGEINQMKITGGGGLSGIGLDFDPAASHPVFDPNNPQFSTSGMTQTDAAQNAIVKIDGITLANTTSNTITDAVTGIDLTLKATNAGKPAQLTVSNDISDFETKVKTFVDAYNKARDTMKNLSKFDVEGKGANSGVLNGNGTVSSALSELRGVLSTVPADASGAFPTLASLGIETSASGTLSFNADKLKAAAQSDFASAAKTIAAYGTAFDAVTKRMNESDGLITRQIDGLNATTTRLNDSISAQERRLAIVQTSYEKQFANLETLLSSMNRSSGYITQLVSSNSGS
ncbi:MAG: flagellar filament capping protein FliD [Candidatus Accumulibacter sp.]|jgi:flagellar hook-associated protein 2|nr:flagellar filament capping protein FliD [Accumulibacter sp.]